MKILVSTSYYLKYKSKIIIMFYRLFGKTNLNLSVFSLGTMRFLESQENAVETLQKAVNLGINHIETARGYGKSEEYLGTALATGLSIKRDQLYVTTKIPPSPDAGIFEQYIDESLNRLNLNYLDCLAIHGLNTKQHLEWVQNPQGCMKAVWQSVADGRVRHVGFSTHGDLELILAAIKTDFFEFVNLHYYYFFQRNSPAIDLAKEKNMGVFIISPADKGGQLYTPPAKLQALCNPFKPLELNYRFLLSDRRVTTLSVGAAKPSELDLPLSYADLDMPLTMPEQAVFEKLEAYGKEVLGAEKCSQCMACLPCPENINIPEVLRLRNLAVGYEMVEFGKYRYRMFENAGHWFWGVKASRCTECGECLPRCPENLDIPGLLQDTHNRLNGQEGRRLWG